MSILNQDLLTLDFGQYKVTYGKHTVPIGTGRADTSRLPARSVLKNALHFEVSTGDPHPSGHPHIFLENGTQTVKMQFDTFPQKI
ncbi:MAG: hypothetical protein IKC03_05645 [Oscillospiraceae bacterium]|nr:hypothetical protein [Oscillospiraceae bacterium]